MYKSYSYNNMPKAVNTTKKTTESPKKELTEKPCTHTSEQPKSLSFLPGRLRTDDLILLIIIAALLINDCDDKLLLLALAYIFFSDYF